MNWTESLAWGAGVALGVWMGSNSNVGPVAWQTCVMLGVLVFGFLQLWDRLATALARALGGPRGEVSDEH